MLINSKVYQKIRSLKPKEIVYFVLAFSVLTYAGTAIPARLVVALSNSVGHRIFYYKPNYNQDELQKGTYVLFDLYTKLRKDCRPCTVIKRIACDEGDVLSSDPHRNYYCNDEYIGTAKLFAKNGTPLEPYKYNGVIPHGKMFVAGACIDSYDSRYFGLIEKNDVKAIAIPIM